MKLTPLNIPDVIVIEPDVFEDERGFFFEAFNQKKFNDACGKNISFVQDNQSFSKKGVLRGLHYQTEPYVQAKLVRSIRGEIFDVALDIREESKTFGNWVSVILSEKNLKQLWIPEGFAHGFYVLSEFAEVIYKTTEFYNKNAERVISYNDSRFNIEWPIDDSVIQSIKDKNISF